MLSATLTRLDAACKAVANIDGVALLAAGQEIEPGWFVIVAPYGVVRIDGQLTTAQQAKLTSVVVGFSPTPIISDQLAEFGDLGQAVMMLKASSQWPKLSLVERTLIQKAIDELAETIIQKLHLGDAASTSDGRPA